MIAQAYGVETGRLVFNHKWILMLLEDFNMKLDRHVYIARTCQSKNVRLMMRHFRIPTTRPVHAWAAWRVYKIDAK